MPAQSRSQRVLKGFWMIMLMLTTTTVFGWTLRDQLAENKWADWTPPSTIVGVPEGSVQYSLRR
jgi:hypothetical protein